MTSTQITLEAAAKLFRVHPRTIVRAISGEHNTYWYEDSNHDMYAISAIAETYDMTLADLTRVIEGRDTLLKPQEAAAEMRMQPRTFRTHVFEDKIRGRISNGRVVRYLRSKIVDQSIARSLR